MAGEEGFALAVILLTVVFRITQDQRRRRFLAKLRLLSRRSGQRRLIGHMLHRQHQKHKQQQQRPRRKRKMVWVHPRPQFWFEQMLVNQYEDHLWQEHFRMTRQTFEYICCLVGPDLVRQDTNMRKSIPVRKRVAIALWRLATGETYRSTGLTFGQGRSTALTMRSILCRLASESK